MPTGTWITWCDTSGTSTNITITADSTWNHWNDNATTATGGTDTVWITWNADGTGDTLNVPYITSPYVDQRTPEQIAADEARWAAERAELKRRADEELQKQREAIAKAKRLLESMLAKEQREQLERDQFFEVIAKNSRRRYRIRRGTHGNVKLLDDAGKEVVSYCAQPHGVPTEDSMLAQALQIEHDEDTFLRVANARRLTA